MEWENTIVGKVQKERAVLLGASLWADLMALKAVTPGPDVFVSRGNGRGSNKHISPSQVQHIVREAALYGRVSIGQSHLTGCLMRMHQLTLIAGHLYRLYVTPWGMAMQALLTNTAMPSLSIVVVNTYDRRARIEKRPLAYGAFCTA